MEFLDVPEATLDRALAELDDDGVGRVGPVVPEVSLARLRARAEALMLGTAVVEGLFFQKDTPTGRYEDLSFGKGYEGPSLDYRKLEKLERDPIFAELVGNPVFERIARRRIDGPIVIYRAALFAKGPAGGSRLPWHQDGGRFWGLDRDPELQIWTALDDAPEGGGCLEAVPGSHRAGLATPLGGVIPAANLVAADAEALARPYPAVAGEVLLVHNHVWHRSGAGVVGRHRRALTVCYMSAATRCLRTKRAPRVFPSVFG